MLDALCIQCQARWEGESVSGQAAWMDDHVRETGHRNISSFAWIDKGRLDIGILRQPPFVRFDPEGSTEDERKTWKRAVSGDLDAVQDVITAHDDPTRLGIKHDPSLMQRNEFTFFAEVPFYMLPPERQAEELKRIGEWADEQRRPTVRLRNTYRAVKWRVRDTWQVLLHGLPERDDF